MWNHCGIIGPMEDPQVIAITHVQLEVYHLDNGHQHIQFKGSRQERPPTVITPDMNPEGVITALGPAQIVTHISELMAQLAIQAARDMESGVVSPSGGPQDGIQGVEHRVASGSMPTPTVIAEDLAGTGDQNA